MYAGLFCNFLCLWVARNFTEEELSSVFKLFIETYFKQCKRNEGIMFLQKKKKKKKIEREHDYRKKLRP